MSRLLIECTYVFEHPDDNSGIQRVVRNIINHLDDKPRTRECIPVAILDGQVHQVNSLKPVHSAISPKVMSKLNRLRMRLDMLQHRYWRKHAAIEQRSPFTSSRNAHRALYVMAQLLSLSFRIPLKALHYLRQVEIRHSRAVPLDVRPDDILVLLDSSWHSNFFQTTEALKKQGLKVVSVIYDLIPLTHPQFCDEGLVRVFESWFDWVSRTADAFICISDTIAEEVRGKFRRRDLRNKQGKTPWVGHFHLGCDLDLSSNQTQATPETERFFASTGNTYLTVSTVEPRKNHAYIVDAFDLAWSRGLDVKLCIIGKVGWKTEALIERIRNHPEYGHRLLMLNQASDAELEYAYQHSRALIFASFVEGFGLPIVEAMHRQLPVIVSDIPVFREVAGDHGLYFDLQHPSSLTEDLARLEADPNLLPKSSTAGFNWLSWEAATDQFLERLQAGFIQTQESSRPDKAVTTL
jgi:glycosyltransferase involved in cell wall biosynthesis